MPRKKKSGQSPARVPGLSNEGGVASSEHTGHPAQGYDGAMASNVPPASSLPCQDRETVVKNMREVFSHLDTEVIRMVLSECDFKVENAMDSLLELSVAAEVTAPLPPHVSGFEVTAAALLNPHHAEPSPDLSHSKSSQQPPSPPLTGEYDFLIDRELETLTKQPEVKEELMSCQGFSAAGPLSSFPLPPIPPSALPELLQSSLEPSGRGSSPEDVATVEHTRATTSRIDQLNLCGIEEDKGQQPVLDFSYLTSETSSGKLNPLQDLGPLRHPSAFQVYKKHELPHMFSESDTVLPSGGVVGGAGANANTVSGGPLGNMPLPWNPEAPTFTPRAHGNQGPAFITPVALSPSPWSSQGKAACHWLRQGTVSKAPIKPSATVPKSWALPAASRGPAPHTRLRLEGKVLVLLRGAPGSGKSTLARAMLEHNPGGVALSTDDYFIRHGKYHFDPYTLGEAHEWNHRRATEAFESGANPIIIDNTHMQAWEMRPYVAQALKHEYKVLFREPDTWWKNKPRELHRRTKHGVSMESIRRMLERYERFVSVQSIMCSQLPEHKRTLHQESGPSQSVSSDTAHPDLVGEPELTQASEKSRPQLFSSLPDVSSIGCSAEVRIPEHSSQNSSESVNLLSTENPKIPDKDYDMDLGELDLELDDQSGLVSQSGDQGIPDCVMESVLSEDDHREELPMAFSESIGQRVRRGRQSKSDVDRLEPADLVKDTNQSGKQAEDVEKTEGLEVGGSAGAEVAWDSGARGRPELLDFIGDWPSKAGLEQRWMRNKEGEAGLTEEADYYGNKNKAEPGPDVTEFQKLLYLIQTGVGSVDIDSSPGSTLSLSSGEESEREGEAGGVSQQSHCKELDSEGRDKDMSGSDSGKAELPDCVLDWKVVGSLVESKLPHKTFEVGEEKIKNTETCTRGGGDHMLEGHIETGFVSLKSKNLSDNQSSLSGDLLFISDTVDIHVTRDREESHSIESDVSTEADTGYADKGNENCTECGSFMEISAKNNGSLLGEVSQSPISSGSVRVESSPLSGRNQERKQRQGRKSGKQCKLALTFTQNCPTSSPRAPEESTHTMPQNLNSSPNSTEPDISDDLSNPDCHLTLDLKPSLDMNPEPSPKHNNESEELQLHSTLTSVVDTGCPTQTYPQDFAFVWRLNHHSNPNDPLFTVGNHPCGITVLSGDASCFHPESSHTACAAVAVTQSSQNEVPYRVVHEKGTQVEEKDLSGPRSRLESLRILSRHFKLVSFDTLEDLYDKCHQDLEWTTNLLLDSGEKFFRDEDEEEEEDGTWDGGNHNTSALCEALGIGLDVGLHSCVVDESHPKDLPGPAGGVEVSQEVSCQGASDGIDNKSDESSNTELGLAGETREDKVVSGTPAVTEQSSGSSCRGTLSHIISTNKDQPNESSHIVKSPQTLLGLLCTDKEEGCEKIELEMTSETYGQDLELEGGAWSGSMEDGGIFEASKDERVREEMSSMDEVTLSLMAELKEIEMREKKQKKVEAKERRDWEERRKRHLNIQSLELKLPTELALQLTELFGPVGIDLGTCSSDDYAVQMDLNLAKLLYQKWKDTIQEGQRQAALSYHLLQESSVHWGESQAAKTAPREETQPPHFLIGADGYSSLGSQPVARDELPFMDHWNVSRPHVSLRDIMTEERARQRDMEKTRQSHADLDRRDGATLLKEKQLYSLFPAVDKDFLQDIFRDHNYCLVQTKQFLNSLLNEEPVKTVVAPEQPRSDPQRTPSKERQKGQKKVTETVPVYQDMEYPEYDDFRAEASLQRKRQVESFAKAAEAYRQGRKEIASFYAHQGRLHQQQMREANHRAAAQIFERVNSPLLPRNMLDLHGLHVDEALEHLAQVLQDKTNEYQQGLCEPQLYVITGRGNHSQGGVARIRPAVKDYLTSKHYRFTEPQPGLMLVSLK
ncbi:NEDD4-binding protein 2 [Lampris incognitus]|uniref:NEDD4-binding protein 2 n=1 Tax=Lampris incognitus TaxID=2546036 RepID=UPI0024B5006E|nr:NEDD4-binding protein 2 [Lampris incognitus]